MHEYNFVVLVAKIRVGVNLKLERLKKIKN